MADVITPQFSEEIEDVILERMLAQISDEVDKRQGSVAYDLAAPASLEFADAYIALDFALSNAFLNEDMPSELLTIAASDFGVDRKDSVKASGQVVISGPVGQLIPAGTQVRTDGGVYFETQTDVTLTGGSATVVVNAVEGGANGNVAASEIGTVVGDLVGIITVTNPQAFEGGVEEESDVALLQRVYDKVRKPATSGNAYHYEQWAKEVAGVGDAKVFPVWDGPGTVKVVLLGEDKQAPAPAIVDDTIAHITTQMPIGADVTVIPAHELAINVNADLTLADGADIGEVTAQIEAAIIDYLKTLAFADSLVRYTRIAAILLDVPRVIDYADLTLNGGGANIETTAEQVAVKGTVTLNAL